MAWTRHGECSHCGWCCQYGAWSTAVVENAQGLSDPQYYRVRGWVLHHVEGVPVQATARIAHYQPCPSFVGVAGVPGCRLIGDPGRPATCHAFPTEPRQVRDIPCSYWFESEAGERIGGNGSPYPTPTQERAAWPSGT